MNAAVNLAANLLLGACVVAALASAARGTVRAARRRRAPVPPQRVSVLLVPVSAHPVTRKRANPVPPLWPDGEPLSTAEAIALDALLDSWRSEDAPGPDHGGER